MVVVLVLCHCRLMFLSPQVHISYFSWISGLPKYTSIMGYGFPRHNTR